MAKWVDLDNIPYVCQDMTVKQLVEKTEIHENVVERSEYEKLKKDFDELLKVKTVDVLDTITCKGRSVKDIYTELEQLKTKVGEAITEIEQLETVTQSYFNDDPLISQAKVLEILKNIGE